MGSLSSMRSFREPVFLSLVFTILCPWAIAFIFVVTVGPSPCVISTYEKGKKWKASCDDLCNSVGFAHVASANISSRKLSLMATHGSWEGL